MDGESDAAQLIGGGGGIAAGSDEPAVGASLSRIAGEGAARAEVLHGLPGWRCCERRSVPERGETGGVIGGRRGALGKMERILRSYGRTVNADDMPFHCLDCSSSQFFNIYHHNAIRDATIDLLNSVASSHTFMRSEAPTSEDAGES